MNGVLEFIDTADFTSMNSGEHFMATDIEWDPTGRFVISLKKSLLNIIIENDDTLNPFTEYLIIRFLRKSCLIF